MWPFNKHEDEDDELPGEGKFPPAEEAFDQPQTPQPPKQPDFGTPQPEPQAPPQPDYGTPEPADPMSFNHPATQEAPQAQRQEADKIEIILAKVDAIKATVEIINHRLDTFEEKKKNEKIF